MLTSFWFAPAYFASAVATWSTVLAGNVFAETVTFWPETVTVGFVSSVLASAAFTAGLGRRDALRRR